MIGKTLYEISNSIENPHMETSGNDISSDKELKDKEDGQVVVDIDLNDEELEFASPKIKDDIEDICSNEPLMWENYARKPYAHQERGIQWLLGLLKHSCSGGLLADDMGLGKTFMSLSYIDHYYKQISLKGETQKPTLIVAPLSLLEIWKDEVAKTFHKSPFKDIVILQANGDLNSFREGGIEIRKPSYEDNEFRIRYSLKVGKRHLQNRLDMPGRLVITTYQTLRDYQFSLCLIDWGIIIFDEAQNIKNPNALQTRASKGVAAKGQFTLLVTGTPVENSLADFWCLMDTALPGFLGSYQEFRDKYIRPILQAAGDEMEETRNRIGRELRIKVGRLMLRRLKEDNLKGLPKKNIYVGINDTGWEFMPCLGKEMSGLQLKVYEEIINNKIDSIDHHLTALKRLRDSSLHPRLAKDELLEVGENPKKILSLIHESYKLKSLVEILDKTKKRKEKCIIFCINKRLQAFLSIGLGSIYKLGPLSIINGDSKAISKRKSVPTRKSMIADFESKDGFNIIIMSPIAAGVGLTIVGANNVIHLERHWNPAKESQATDRVYRIGQKKDVNIYVPLLLHPKIESFDLNLHKLLIKKTLLKDSVVTSEDVIPNPEGMQRGNIPIDKVIEFEDLKKLNWRDFEALVIELLSKELSVKKSYLTALGKDYGADGILITNECYSLIQVKHTKSTYNGYKAVQEIIGSVCAYAPEKMQKKLDSLYFVTNAMQLSKDSRKLAEASDHKVEIYDGHKLLSLLKKHRILYKQIISRLSKDRYVLDV